MVEQVLSEELSVVFFCEIGHCIPLPYLASTYLSEFDALPFDLCDQHRETTDVRRRDSAKISQDAGHGARTELGRDRTAGYFVSEKCARGFADAGSRWSNDASLERSRDD